jgi:cobalt-precorrin 5A hydrolase
MRRIAGIGCRADAPLSALREVVAMVGRPDALATLEGRAQVVRPLAAALGLPLILIAPEVLRGIATPTQSPRILTRFGTGSVAEALALAAMPGSQISTARQQSTDGSATAALATGSHP